MAFLFKNNNKYFSPYYPCKTDISDNFHENALGMSITSNAKTNIVNNLNLLKFGFLLPYLFERKSLNSLSYIGMLLYLGVYLYGQPYSISTSQFWWGNMV